VGKIKKERRKFENEGFRKAKDAGETRTRYKEDREREYS
jgi:hypothetical protein